MYDPAQVRRSFSAAAERYAEAAALPREVEDRMLERLDFVSSLDPQVVLDLGAGPGRATSELAQRFEQAQVVSLDLSLDMLKCHPQPPTGFRIAADSHQLPLADASVDLIFSNLMLQWCADVGQVIAEMRRVLRPDGVLMFSTFGPDTLRELRAAWAGVDSGAHVSSFIDMRDLGDGMLACGLANPVVDVDHIVLTYEKVRGLMADLKAWGAHNMRSDRPRALTGKGRLAAMMDAYESFRRDDGLIPATFEIVYGFARGAAVGQPTRTGQGEEASFSVDHLRRSRRPE